MKRQIHEVLAALVATGLIAGCGGDSAPDAPAAAIPTAAAPAVDPLQPSGGADPALGPTPQELASLAAAAVAAAPVEKQIMAAPTERRIAGQYIVTLREDSGASAKSIDEKAALTLKRAGGGVVQERFTKALQGYSATMSETTARALLSDPDVEAIEEDQIVEAGAIEQPGATWGLDRIDQRTLPLSGSYRYEGAAANVTAYIVDSGIRATHAEFRTAPGAATSRVRPEFGYSAIFDGRKTDDCNGHGTHVSGTVGGLTYGVAKQVTLVPVRVLGCDNKGSWSGIIAGLEFVARNARKPAVANLSLGGGISKAVDTAVANLVAAGVPVVVAAGNSNADACTVSPARVPTVLTVGASTKNDARAAFSNYGSCVALFAPGESITSSVNFSDTKLSDYSGTSMAAPHVAGAAALLLSATPTLTPAQVTERVKALATPNVVSNPGNGMRTSLLLFSNPGGEQSAPAPVKMVVSNLSGKSTAVDGNWWTATVTVAVKDTSGARVEGANVFGGFSIGGNPLSCTTNAAGVCTVGTLRLSRSDAPDTVFTVTGITATGKVHDTTLDTAPRQVRVLRP